MVIRTFDCRVIILNDSVELLRTEEQVGGKAVYKIILQSINEAGKQIVALETDDADVEWHTYCQAIGLLRSRYTALLDFEAMARNPNMEEFDTDSIEWSEKKKRSAKANGRGATRWQK